MILIALCFLHILLGLFNSIDTFRADFCDVKFNCGKQHEIKNDVCKFGCKPAKSVVPYPADFVFRNATVYWHNYYRNQLATGKLTEGGNEAASNMLALNYDMELEYAAACWIYHQGETEYSHCMVTPKYGPTGQIYTSTFSQFRPDTFENIGMLIYSIYLGYRDCTAEIIDKYAFKNDQLDVFAQLMWAETAYVGCARYIKDIGKCEEYMYFCNYAPHGVNEGQPVYKKGAAASACPEGKEKNTQFEGLCGDVKFTAAMKKDGHPDLPNIPMPLPSLSEHSRSNVICVMGSLSYLLSLNFRESLSM